MKAEGTGLRGRHCVLVTLAKPAEPTRIGFVISRRNVGGAVERNRARRRLREILRLRWPRISSQGYWFVFIVFRSLLAASHEDLASDVERLLANAGALAPIPAGNAA